MKLKAAIFVNCLMLIGVSFCSVSNTNANDDIKKQGAFFGSSSLNQTVSDKPTLLKNTKQDDDDNESLSPKKETISFDSAFNQKKERYLKSNEEIKNLLLESNNILEQAKNQEDSPLLQNLLKAHKAYVEVLHKRKALNDQGLEIIEDRFNSNSLVSRNSNDDSSVQGGIKNKRISPLIRMVSLESEEKK